MAAAALVGAQAAPALAIDGHAAAAAEAKDDARTEPEALADLDAAKKAEAEATGSEATAGAGAAASATTSRSAAANAATAALRAVQPGDVQARSAPTDVDVTVDEDQAAVTIVWTLPDANTAEVGFRLHGASDVQCPGTATVSGSCELTAVPAGSYDVQYREDGGGWVDAGVGADVPVAPATDVSVTPTVHGLSVTWAPSASPGVTGYVATATPVEPEAGDQPVECTSLTGCSLTGLAYRDYAVSVVAEAGADESAEVSVEATPLPEVPAAPTGVRARVSGPNAITISWNAVTSAHGVPIRYMGVVAGQEWGTGCWDEPMDALTCTIDGLPNGTAYTIIAYAIGDELSEPGRMPGKLMLPLPARVPANAPELDSDLGGADPVAGGEVTISGDGFEPFSTVVLAIYSAPVVLGSVTVDADGAFSATVRLPAGYTGRHTLVASGLDPAGNPRYLALAVDIAEAGGQAGGDAGGLPVTGSPVVLLLVVGLGLVVAGGAAMVAARPRRAVAAG